ncbi:hypothetical protein G6M89_06970 [Natronolimnobius sp. AArcel1]|uniref:YIP1 family protein n=1 Tax=Natronolimnobius sp. AArcel1 TaxID=1679093 RepID=UPI0013EADED5|nr:YIP1 family protein [Natronolimnobius sp. AArcel1]NGM68752.1 hypothetical protein [Natronolimnobius sp. AArcel1]
MVPTTPLFDPEEYFSREGDASLTTAITVTAVFWIAMVAYMSIYMWYLFDVATELPEASLGGIIPLTALLMGLTVLLIWLLITTILHGITRVAGGSGSLKTTFEIAAWGLGAYAIAVFAQAATTPFTVPSESITAEDPADIAVQFAAEAPLSIAIITLLTLAVATVWAVYIWTYSMAQTHDISVRRAAAASIIAAVFVPLVLGVF